MQVLEEVLTNADDAGLRARVATTVVKLGRSEENVARLWERIRLLEQQVDEERRWLGSEG